jgi:hypothetical protein
MKSGSRSLSTSRDTDLAASVAPEDLRCGDFVAVLSVIHEFPSFFWCGGTELAPRDQPVRIQHTGGEDGLPFKVKAICLPFVLVKDSSGNHRTFDVRLCRLARVSGEYGRKVWKVFRRTRPESALPSVPPIMPDAK